MLKIRLQRTGRTNDPSFRVVVTEHTSGPKAGKAVEIVGAYNPKTKVRQLNGERIQYWMEKGAQATPTMHNMLVSAGVIKGDKINVLPKKTPIKKEEEAKPEAAAPTATEAPAAEDAPAAEKKKEEAAAPQA